MAFEITLNALQASEQTNKKFNIVLEIEGISTLFGVQQINKIIKIGDPGLTIGGGWVIGGLNSVLDQSPYISYSAGTSTTLSQVLNEDKGEGDTVTRYQIALIDKDKQISNILAPGNVVEDILGRRCNIWGGFESTAWRDDYVVLHRGIIDDYKSGHGQVTINIASPEILKKGEIFLQVETELSSGLSSGATVADVVDTSNFLQKVTGPDGTIDSTFRTYLRIDDEIMEYESISGNQFQGLTRAQLGTSPATHNNGTSVASIYRIGPIDPMLCALKIMLSGTEGNFLENIEASRFVRTVETTLVPNTIFFDNLDLVQLYNIQPGDYVTTSGAINGANNVSLKQIAGIDVTNGNTILTIDGVSFVEELDTSALVSFRSQYDVWPTGAGLALKNFEVDIDQHEDIRSNFLSSDTYDFYLKDTIKGKEFIAGQVYNPVSCFSIPRKAAASVGIHRPPIPGTEIKTLSADNVLNAGKLKLERTINKNFFNAVIYKYEELATEDEFIRGVVNTNATSITRIPVGNKPLTIESKGFRDALSAQSVATDAASRRLNKYKFGAEFIRGIQVNLTTGFTIEIGDSVVIDISSLQITDTVTGTRSGEARLFDITNRKINTKTGVVTLDAIDSNVDKDLRYGLISPASFINIGSTVNSVNIKPSFNTDQYGVNEYKKWQNLIGAAVIVRSQDYSISDTSTITQITGNTFTLGSALSFTPLEDYLIELDIYDNQPESVKLIYAFMQDNPTFADGKPQYVQI